MRMKSKYKNSINNCPNIEENNNKNCKKLAKNILKLKN